MKTRDWPADEEEETDERDESIERIYMFKFRFGEDDFALRIFLMKAQITGVAGEKTHFPLLTVVIDGVCQ